MKNTLIIVALVLVVAVGVFVYQKKNGVLVQTPNQNQNSSTEDLVIGCYVANLGQDVYTLKIETQGNGNFVGELSFKNFQKDSSSGTYEGTYKDGILLGDYSFTSEGTDSVMQVIFRKSGDTFVRGFGDLDEAGTRFSDLSSITYDPKQTFILTTNCPT